MRFVRKLTYRLERRSAHFLIVVMLGVVSTAVVLLGAVVYSLMSGDGIERGVWWAFVRITDTGYFGQEPGGTDVWANVASTLISMFGLVVFLSLVIGVMSDKVAEFVGNVRAGNRPLVFSDHVVILGWSQKVFAIVAELHIANPNGEVAILGATVDKETADHELGVHVFEPLRRRVRADGRRYPVNEDNVVFRHGNPANAVDLERVGIRRARAVIVVGPDAVPSPQDRDVRAIKALLAAKSECRPDAAIVAEVFERENVRLARIAGGPSAVVVCAADIVSRIVVQSSLQPGLAAVVEDILSFEGSEVHLKRVPDGLVKHDGAYSWPELVDALIANTDDHVPMGVYRDGGVAMLPESWEFLPGDEIVFLCEDDSPLRLSADVIPLPEGGPPDSPPIEHKGERKVLVLGYNAGLHTLVALFAEYVEQYPDLSVSLHIVSPSIRAQDREELLSQARAGVSVAVGSDTYTKAEVAERLLSERDYDVVIILSEEHSDFGEADAEVLMTLLTVRDLQGRSGGPRASITTELVDPEHRDLVARQHVQDIVISHRLFSMLVAQLSLDPRLAPVLDDFFSYEGAEMYLRPARVYARADERLSFEEIVRRSARRGEIALGVRLVGDGAGRVLLNPPHREIVPLDDDDQVIVFANE